MTLTLTQSIPQFAKDGAIKFFLAPEVDAAEDLKFDPSTPDGVGSRIKPLHALGSGTFKKVETGKTESFSLTVDETVRERIKKGGKLFVVIVPADATVAATYFGANESVKEKGPRLTLGIRPIVVGEMSEGRSAESGRRQRNPAGTRRSAPPVVGG